MNGVITNHCTRAGAAWPRLALSIICCVWLAACATGGTSQLTGAGTDTGGFDLPAPQAEAVHASSALHYRLGADFSQVVIPPNNVVANGDNAVFSPDWVAGDPPEDAAYAMYVLFTSANQTEVELDTTWLAAPAEGDLWLGVANYAEASWDWYPCTNEGPDVAAAVIPDLAQHLAFNPAEYDDGMLLAVPLLIGNTQCELTRVALAGLPPEINSVTPTHGTPGQAVTFTADIVGDGITSYSWNFGSGASPSITNEASPAVVLGGAGTYVCSLIVSNADGSGTFPFTLEVTDDALLPPEITSVTPAEGVPDQLVTFHATVLGRDITGYEWDFNGGATPEILHEKEPNVRLGAVGTYTGSVKATNANGSDTFEFTYEVSEDALAVLALNPCCGFVGDTLQITADVNPDNPDAIHFSFGPKCDPVEANANPATVTLLEPGDLLVEVTATYGSEQVVCTLPFSILPDPDTLPADTLVAVPLETAVTLGSGAEAGGTAEVTVAVMTGAAAHPFYYLAGTAIEVERAAQYATASFELGVPDNTPDIFGYEEYGYPAQAVPIDGLWAGMGATSIAIPPEALIRNPFFENGQTHCFCFSVIPTGGANLTAAQGVLYCFKLKFDTPGVYHLGFLKEDESFKRTYYDDSSQTEYFWGDDSNNVEGFANTITVTAP